jgi:hypothetical protein
MPLFVPVPVPPLAVTEESNCHAIGLCALFSMLVTYKEPVPAIDPETECAEIVKLLHELMSIAELVWAATEPLAGTAVKGTILANIVVFS